MEQNNSNEDHDRMADKLHGIIRKNKESENAYYKAVERAVSTELKSYFHCKFDKRKGFDGTLTREVSIAFPEPRPTTWSENHTGPWIDTEALLCSADDTSMLKAAIAGDWAAVSDYTDILEERLLPFEIYHLIRKHKMWIEVDLHKFKSVEDLRQL